MIVDLDGDRLDDDPTSHAGSCMALLEMEEIEGKDGFGGGNTIMQTVTGFA